MRRRRCTAHDKTPGSTRIHAARGPDHRRDRGRRLQFGVARREPGRREGQGAGLHVPPDVRSALGLHGPGGESGCRGDARQGDRPRERAPPPADFIAFTGDLTHATDDPEERRKRLAHVRNAVGQLKVKVHRYLPGKHDASRDQGEAFKEFFGKTHYTFDHKGVHFIVLDNVSDPKGMLRDEQIQWLRADLSRLDKEAPIVVLTHHPLFDLAPDWDWTTADGAAAIE